MKARYKNCLLRTGSYSEVGSAEHIRNIYKKRIFIAVRSNILIQISTVYHIFNKCFFFLNTYQFVFHKFCVYSIKNTCVSLFNFKTPYRNTADIIHPRLIVVGIPVTCKILYTSSKNLNICSCLLKMGCNFTKFHLCTARNIFTVPWNDKTYLLHNIISP